MDDEMARRMIYVQYADGTAEWIRADLWPGPPDDVDDKVPGEDYDYVWDPEGIT